MCLDLCTVVRYSDGMVKQLIEKLERVAATHPDPKVRAAAKRDADGYRKALAAKQG